MRESEGMLMPTWLEGIWIEDSADKTCDELRTRDLNGNMGGWAPQENSRKPLSGCARKLRRSWSGTP